MQVITIESEAFQEILVQLETKFKELIQEKKGTNLSEKWLDNQDVCGLLYCSKRTLQNYRDSGKLSFSKIGAKIFYRCSDIEDLLNQHYSETNNRTPLNSSSNE